MSEVLSGARTHESLRAVYWNVLCSADPGHQFAYFESIVETHNPDSVVLTECPSQLHERIEKQYPHVYYKPTIKEGDIWEGMLAYTQQPTEVRPFSYWPNVESGLFFGRGKRRSDDREFVRFTISKDGIGKVALLGVHITHPHHLWAPSLALRRCLEWDGTEYEMAVAATEQENPAHPAIVVMGDTNTFRDSVMLRRLGLHHAGGTVVEKTGGNTWGYIHPRSPRLADIDKIAVTKPLVGRTAGHTLPRVVGGIPNPSDHRAILAVVK